MTAGIFLEVNGEPVDISRLAWYRKAPCGCVSGSAMAYLDHNGQPDIVITTADQAAAAFAGTKEERKRDDELGFTVFVDLLANVTDLMTGCPHDPKYGVPPVPTVDRHVWAAVHCHGSNPKYRHLVSEDAVAAARDRRFDAGNTKPLCGAGKGAFWWSNDWYAISGKPECKNCIARAARGEAS